jgi:hypothetical protein
MGMVIIPAIIAYIFLSIGLYKFAKRITPKRWVHTAVIAIMVLIPTYDTIITYTLAGYYCATEPHPKTYIKHTVENPISIYWEDNIYPGYDENDTKLMIMNYLDGIHLKTMALNTPDGKVKIYSATLNDWNETKRIKAQHDDYFKSMEKETQIIMAKAIIITKAEMPMMNYTVTLDEVKLPSLPRKFLYSDEVKVRDNKVDENIGYNRRYMDVQSDFLAEYYQSYYDANPICGLSRSQNFNVFSHLIERINIAEHLDLSEKLYKKYNTGDSK